MFAIIFAIAQWGREREHAIGLITFKASSPNIKLVIPSPIKIFIAKRVVLPFSHKKITRIRRSRPYIRRGQTYCDIRLKELHKSCESEL